MRGDRPVHRALPQGGDRRAGRCATAAAGRAPALPARAGGTARGDHRVDQRAEQDDAGAADAISHAADKTRLEDLYLPYKPKRRTKAQIALEAGLLPLADALLADPMLNPEVEAGNT